MTYITDRNNNSSFVADSVLNACMEEVCALERSKAIINESLRVAKEELLNRMIEDGYNDIRTIDGDASFKIAPSGVRNQIDVKTLRKEMPEIAERFSREVPYSASVRVTLYIDPVEPQSESAAESVSVDASEPDLPAVDNVVVSADGYFCGA